MENESVESDGAGAARPRNAKRRGVFAVLSWPFSLLAYITKMDYRRRSEK